MQEVWPIERELAEVHAWIGISLGGLEMWQIAFYGTSGLLGDGLTHLLEKSGYRVDRIDPEASGDAPSQEVDLILVEDRFTGADIDESLHSIGRRFPRARIILLVQPATDSEFLRSALLNGVQGCVETTAPFATVLSAVETVLHGQIVCPPVMRNWLRFGAASLTAPDNGLPQARAGQRVEQDLSSQELTAKAPSGSPVAARTLADEHAGCFSSARPTGREERHQADTSPPSTTVDAASVSLSGRETEILWHLTRGDANKVIARRLDISEATVKSHLKSLLRKLNFNNRTQAAIWAINSGRCESPVHAKR